MQKSAAVKCSPACRSPGLKGGLAAPAAAKALVESVNATSSVNHLLLAGIKWMTLGAHIQMDILADGGPRLYDVPATASCRHFLVSWMNFWFHAEVPSANDAPRPGEKEPRILTRVTTKRNGQSPLRNALENSCFLEVAIAVPLRQTFLYELPASLVSHAVIPGMRVRVPFGRTTRVGLVTDLSQDPGGAGLQANGTRIAIDKIKAVIEVLDDTPVFDVALLALLTRAAEYYHHPIGEVFSTALPTLLRRGEPVRATTEVVRAVGDGTGLARAPRQQEIISALLDRPGGMSRSELRAQEFAPSALRALRDKKLVIFERSEDTPAPWRPASTLLREHGPTLSQAQHDAVQTAATAGCHLLYGITGSGKTEVYLQSIDRVLQTGRQVLVLVPEIGLTPQTVRRFTTRFDAPVEVLHSALTDNERLAAWRSAANGSAAIVIGTRSAVFTRFADLGLVIVDEEHDGSYKQMDGFRYSARDLAVMRGARNGIPVILGSATPALETYANALAGRYSFSTLSERAGGAQLPAMRVIDVRNQAMQEGFSEPLVTAINEHIAAGSQVLVFLNRRGFAEVLLCRSCGWQASCTRCDSRMTYHHLRRQLICHHCGSAKTPPALCPGCKAPALVPLGTGTERLESRLTDIFPDTHIVRVDRDSTRGKRALEERLAGVHSGGPALLVGTQLLAKGHHFPNVTLVAIIDIDSGFYSGDFKAIERMGQLVVQVGGRAGREDKAGTVILQTHQPGHPALAPILRHDYLAFANQLLAERAAGGLPPATHAALLRAEATRQGWPIKFLSDVRRRLSATGSQLWGPVPAPMEKRAGRFRAQLLILDKTRPQLARTLKAVVAAAAESNLSPKVRWSIDVDPVDMS